MVLRADQMADCENVSLSFSGAFVVFKVAGGWSLQCGHVDGIELNPIWSIVCVAGGELTAGKVGRLLAVKTIIEEHTGWVNFGCRPYGPAVALKRRREPIARLKPHKTVWNSWKSDKNHQFLR